MPGRYTIAAKVDEINDRFEVKVPDDYQQRYNAAPTQLLPVITSNSPEGLSFFYWGIIPGWSKNKAISPKLINAPSETLNQKASYKSAMKSRRCIVPADGFYAWKRISKKGKVPHRIIINDHALFSFAGLWEEFEDDNDKTVHTFTIVTTPANPLMEVFDSRMPAILTKADEKAWLEEKANPEDLLTLLQPFPEGKMGHFSVSPRVNDVENEGESLIHPSAPIDQFGNYSLFD